MAVFIRALGWTAKGTLEGVGVDDVELFEHHHPASCLFAFVCPEQAVVVAKVFAVFAHQPRKYLLLRG